jgi:DNA polymerase-1
MKIIHTDTTDPSDLKPFERDQVYNGLDCCVTAEVLDVLLPQLDNLTRATYAFSRALQGPVLEMRLRGVLVDQHRKAEVIEEYFQNLDHLERNLERIVREGIGYYGFNWRSNDDLKRLFYDELGIPPVKFQGRITVNANALERISDYLPARQIVAHMLAMRDIAKKISTLKTSVDRDGRIRTSYNIAGTSTGRFSSSFSEFGTGGNLQNIEESLRSVFIADPGMKMAKFDAKSGESYCVGAIEWNLFRDSKYLDACESGDPHTATARAVWTKELPWTGDLKRDKEIAETPYYRHYTYRFMCKKLGHGSNYLGKASTLAQQSRVDISAVDRFQIAYFKAYPAHLRWHAYKRQELRETGQLTSLTGRRRYFFGRRDADETVREAMAYDPQCSLADIVNSGMLHVWRQREAVLLMHDHDALTVQYPEEIEDEVVPKILEQLRYPIELADGRILEIPYDCVVGWNKGKYHEKDNVDGLKEYIPSDQRRRTPQVGLLDRIVSGVHR